MGHTYKVAESLGCSAMTGCYGVDTEPAGMVTVDVAKDKEKRVEMDRDISGFIVVG